MVLQDAEWGSAHSAAPALAHQMQALQDEVASAHPLDDIMDICP